MSTPDTPTKDVRMAEAMLVSEPQPDAEPKVSEAKPAVVAKPAKVKTAKEPPTGPKEIQPQAGVRPGFRYLEENAMRVAKQIVPKLPDALDRAFAMWMVRSSRLFAVLACIDQPNSEHTMAFCDEIIRLAPGIALTTFVAGGLCSASSASFSVLVSILYESTWLRGALEKTKYVRAEDTRVMPAVEVDFLARMKDGLHEDVLVASGALPNWYTALDLGEHGVNNAVLVPTIRANQLFGRVAERIISEITGPTYKGAPMRKQDTACVVDAAFYLVQDERGLMYGLRDPLENPSDISAACANDIRSRYHDGATRGFTYRVSE